MIIWASKADPSRLVWFLSSVTWVPRCRCMRRLPQQLVWKTLSSGFFVYDGNKAVEPHGNQHMVFLVFPDSHKNISKPCFKKAWFFAAHRWHQIRSKHSQIEVVFPPFPASSYSPSQVDEVRWVNGLAFNGEAVTWGKGARRDLGLTWATACINYYLRGDW